MISYNNNNNNNVRETDLVVGSSKREKREKFHSKKVPVTSREERLRDALAENRRCESSSLKSPLDLNSFGNCGSIRVTSSLGGNLQNKKN